MKFKLCKIILHVNMYLTFLLLKLMISLMLLLDVNICFHQTVQTFIDVNKIHN